MVYSFFIISIKYVLKVILHDNIFYCHLLTSQT